MHLAMPVYSKQSENLLLAVHSCLKILFFILFSIYNMSASFEMQSKRIPSEK